jgi:hypothetical protein
MKRWVLRAILCLLLGAITTVAVAWGISLFSNGQDRGDGDLFLLEHESRWIFVTTEGVGWHSLRIAVSETYDDLYDETPIQSPPKWSELASLTKLPILPSGDPLTISPVGWVNWQERAFGFPSLSLAWTHFFRDGGQVRNGVVVSGSESFWDWRILPLRPIWSGFMIDTFFYASIWFGVFFAPGMAKRAIRRKRGRCPRCGYDLRGGVISDKRLAISGAGCPECGWNRPEIKFDNGG